MTAIANRELLADLDAGARIDRLSVGEPEPQAGPYHEDMWSWEICFRVTLPSGACYEWCFSITITVSTDWNDAARPGEPIVLANDSDGVPFELCWDETDEDGHVVTHCIEITINTGGDGRKE